MTPYRIPAALVLLSVALGLPARAAGSCDAALAAALAKPPEKLLPALRKAADHCPDHAPTLTELGFQLMADPSGGLGPLGEARDALEKAVAIDPVNVKARWGAALLLIYLGEYEKALAHAGWLAGPEAPADGRAEAGAHVATCRFMAALVGRPAGDALPADDEAWAAGAGWQDLQRLGAGVAIAGGFEAGSQDRATVDRVLGLMEDWIRRPPAPAIPERAVLLGGAIESLAAVAHRAAIEDAVARTASAAGLATPPWPPRDAARLDRALADLPLAEGRTFEIGDDLTVSEAWNLPDIAGEWTFRRFAGSCSESIQLPATRTKVTVEQRGAEVSFGTPPFRCRMSGRSLECARREPRVQDYVDLTLSCRVEPGDGEITCDYEATGSVAVSAPATGSPHRADWTCQGKASLWRGE